MLSMFRRKRNGSSGNNVGSTTSEEEAATAKAIAPHHVVLYDNDETPRPTASTAAAKHFNAARKSEIQRKAPAISAADSLPLTPQEPPISTTPPRATPEKGTRLVSMASAWKETCLKQGTLVASWNQVLENDPTISIVGQSNGAGGVVHDVVPYHDPKAQSDVVERFCSRQQKTTSPFATPSKDGQKQPDGDASSTPLSYVASAAKVLASPIIGALLTTPDNRNDFDDDSDLPLAVDYSKNDDEVDMHDATNGRDGNKGVKSNANNYGLRGELQDHELALHVGLTVEALQSLATAWEHHGPPHNSSDAPLTRRPMQRNANTVANIDSTSSGLGVGCWRDWMMQTVGSNGSNAVENMVQQWVKRLPADQADFLLQCLAKGDVLTLQERSDELEDLIFRKGLGPEQMEVQTAIFDVYLAIQRQEENIARWSAAAAKCHQAASVAKQQAAGSKKHPSIKKALFELQRYKLYDKKRAEASEALLNLEKVKATLEHAVEQRAVLQALQTSRDTLKSWRLQQKEQQAAPQTVVASLQEELDHVQDEDSLLQSLSPATTGTEEDEELLRQLGELAIEDKTGNAKPSLVKSQSSALTNKKATMSKQEPKSKTLAAVIC